jgi:hypothetical protein
MVTLTTVKYICTYTPLYSTTELRTLYNWQLYLRTLRSIYQLSTGTLNFL